MNEKTSFGKRNWIILILFGLVGQIAWSVENMYFNLFVYDMIDTNLNAITLMVQLSGLWQHLLQARSPTVQATVANLYLSDIPFGALPWRFSAVCHVIL